MSAAEAPFDSEVVAALRAVGAEPSDPAIDALADLGGALAAIDAAAGRPVLLRAAEPLGPSTEHYAPDPADPLWIRLPAEVSDRVRVAGFRAPASAAEARASGLTIDEEERPCCHAPSCALRKTRASLWVALAGGPASRLLLAEAVAPSADEARAALAPLASRLAGRLGVPFEEQREEPEALRAGGSEPPLAPLAAASLARFAVRNEGARVVLRDFASAGPRGVARARATIGFVLLAAAVAGGVGVAASLRSERTGLAIAAGIAAALLSLTAYAFLGVARFAAKYVARSAPLVALAPGRIVVAPWVSRTGAVDMRPEGRLGAAIPLGEVRGAAVRARDREHVIELDTDHGPIDALKTPSEEVAAYFCAALRRRIAEAAHPDARPSARQRARARREAKPSAPI